MSALRGLFGYFRVNASLASIASTPGKPAARSAVAAGLSGPFSHGNFAAIPRVTGSPSAPPKSSGQNRVAHGARMAAAAVAAVGMDCQHAGCRFAPLRGLDLDRQAIFMAGPVDSDLVADEECRQQHNRPDPLEIHLVLETRRFRSMHAWHTGPASVKPARSHRLDPGRVLAKD